MAGTATELKEFTLTVPTTPDPVAVRSSIDRLRREVFGFRELDTNTYSLYQCSPADMERVVAWADAAFATLAETGNYIAGLSADGPTMYEKGLIERVESLVGPRI